VCGESRPRKKTRSWVRGAFMTLFFVRALGRDPKRPWQQRLAPTPPKAQRPAGLARCRQGETGPLAAEPNRQGGQGQLVSLPAQPGGGPLEERSVAPCREQAQAAWGPCPGRYSPLMARPSRLPERRRPTGRAQPGKPPPELLGSWERADARYGPLQATSSQAAAAGFSPEALPPASKALGEARHDRRTRV